MRKPTLQDIADEAGTCKATVSYVLNGKHQSKRISERTAERIVSIANSMGYKIDDVARTMSTGRANAIGFISSCNINNEYVSGVLTGAMEKADSLKLSIKLIHHQWGMKKEEILYECRRHRLSGLLCYDFKEEANEFLLAHLSEDGIPLAFVSNTEVPTGAIHVMADDRQGAGLAVRHLGKLGHERIAFMSGNYGRPYEVDRRNGYWEMLKELGLEMSRDFIVSTNEKREMMEFVNRMCAMKNGPTALFCTSDTTAIAMISHLHRIGKRVPDDMSVVGYGDFFAGRAMIPTVTTVAEPYPEVGAVAVEMIYAQLSLKGPPGGRNLLPVKLIERESTSNR